MLAGVTAAVLAAGIASAPPPPPPILPGLSWPQALQGHDDENWPEKMVDAQGGPTTDLLARYEVIKSMQPGIRRYNMDWAMFEASKASSATSPAGCPGGTTQVPATEAERFAFGYHRFRCIDNLQVAKFDTILQLDTQAGAQGGAIIYSTPQWYRHPNCTGFKFGPDRIWMSCPPVDAHMGDFEDFVRFLVRRWSPRNLQHLVVWNEVASAMWMDMQPFIPNQAGPGGSNPLTPAQIDLWVTKYAALVQRSAAAVASAGLTDAVMVWTSNDRLWERPVQREGDPLHIGVKTMLDGIWPKLAAANVTFGTAVHPYDPCNPFDGSEFAPGHHPQAYTFATLGHITAYAAGQVRSVLGLDPSDPKARPFQLLYASEQGWPSPMCGDNRVRARNICYAHALASAVPEVVGVTHNFFHDDPSGSEQGGQDYGLIPGNVSGNLTNGPGHPTFDAYVATSPAQWNVNDAHFCCATWRMGCLNKRGSGTLDPLTQTGTRAIAVHGWAWDERAAGAGGAPVSVRLSFVGLPVDPVTLLANVSRPDLVAAGVAPNAEHGFQLSLDLSPNRVTGPYKVVAEYVAPNGTLVELTSSPRCGDVGGPRDCPP